MKDRFVAARQNEKLLEQPKKLIVAGILHDQDVELKLRMWIGLLENDLDALMNISGNVSITRAEQLMHEREVVEKMHRLTEGIFTPLQHGNAVLSHLNNAYQKASVKSDIHAETVKACICEAEAISDKYRSMIN